MSPPSTPPIWWRACGASCRRSITSDGDLVQGGHDAVRHRAGALQTEARAGAGGRGGCAGDVEADGGRLRSPSRSSKRPGLSTKVALDNATANRDNAVARLKQAEVETKEAALNLGYTQVKAPFDGIVTARKVSLGELVGANGPTQLATIVQTNPVYVNFTISEQEVLNILRRDAPPRRQRARADVDSDRGRAAGRRGLSPSGNARLHFAQRRLRTTGTLAVRAILQNTK